jgi:AhpD family alkylhydroperoxidase
MTSSNRRRATGLVAASALLALAAGAALLPAGPAASADTTTTREDVYKDIEKTLGTVPAFVKQFPSAILAGSWQEEKDLELSDKTALPPKVKALISLAVAAQIPCTYCVWADTAAARQFGATDEEIGEAVAMAGLTRQFSTLFNGLQVDFEQFKKDLGGATAAK